MNNEIVVVNNSTNDCSMNLDSNMGYSIHSYYIFIILLLPFSFCLS